MTPGDRIDPQPVTLDVRPVSLASEPDRDRALAAANGVDLLAVRLRRIAAVVGPVVLLAFVIACIVRGGR